IGFTRAFAQAEKYSMAYQALEDRYWPYLAYFAEQQGLRDLLLISPGGDVVFSAAQSDWYGSNIYAENGSGQPLQRIFRQAMVQADGVIILNTHSDAQTAYIAAPVFQSTLTG